MYWYLTLFQGHKRDLEHREEVAGYDQSKEGNFEPRGNLLVDKKRVTLVFRYFDLVREEAVPDHRDC
jgi:hypothetical protein